MRLVLLLLSLLFVMLPGHAAGQALPATVSTTRAAPGETLTITLPTVGAQRVTVTLLDQDGTVTPLRVGTQVGRLVTRVMPTVPGGRYELTIQLGATVTHVPFTVLHEIDRSQALVFLAPTATRVQFERDLRAADLPVNPQDITWVDLPGTVGACQELLALVPLHDQLNTGALLDGLQTVPGVVGADAEGWWRADPISVWDGGGLTFPPSMDDYYLPPLLGTQDIGDFQGQSSGVTIAFLDTGLAPATRAAFGPRLKAPVDARTDVRPDQRDTSDHFRDTDLAYPAVGHGSVVARMAAGPQGVARQATVWPIKVCDKYGYCRTSSVLQGLCAATAGVAPKQLVINLSLGGNTPNAGIRRTLQAAIARGTVVVASVGNEPVLASAGRTQSQQHYPAADKGDPRLAPSLQGMLVVGAAVPVRSGVPGPQWQNSPTTRKAPYLDLLAPGYQEVLFVNDAGTVVPAGTPGGRPTTNMSAASSYATGLASGVAALWRAYCPATRELSSAALVSLMRERATAGPSEPGFLSAPNGEWWPDVRLQLPNGGACD